MDKIVINWHITEECNYVCKHCFVKYAKSTLAIVSDSLQDSENLLCKVYKAFKREYSEIRLNIAGGEPLLVSNLSLILQKAKDIGFEVSLISNASYLARPNIGLNGWIEQNAKSLSMLGMSVDSLQHNTNIKIGRYAKVGNTLQTLQPYEILQIANDLKRCNENLKIKINTVVTNHNYAEYFGDFISVLKPHKWKVLQALSIGTQKIFCTDLEYRTFLDNHKDFASFISAESKSQMTNSYIMLDCFGRFYQNEHSHYSYSPSVLEMSDDEILKYANFDKVKFQNRYRVGA